MTRLDYADRSATTQYTHSLYQPIVTRHPEEGHARKNVLPLSEFLTLLKEEEDYFAGEETHLPVMITRLRKIFYDKWGWNKELIRGAAAIECRYEVKIVDAPPRDEAGQTRVKKAKRYRKNNEVEKYRLVTYRENDRVYGNTRTGQVAPIYQNDHQEVILPDGSYCDIAHVLAGLDAWNNPQCVSPLPGWLETFVPLFPHCSSNMDLVTWLGDIATSAEDFVFHYLRNNKQPLTSITEQHYINVNAPGSDMLGDIDSYAIAKCYDLSGASGKRLSEILQDYYAGPGSSYYAKKRYPLFCDAVGLQWDGEKFANEEEWINKYRLQLRDATTFMIFSLTEENLKSILLPFEVWCNAYSDVVKAEPLLRLFLKTLQSLLREKQNS